MKLALSLIVASTLCLAGSAAAAEFDSEKAAATAGALADQVKAIRADVDPNPDAPEALKKDLRYIEVHARHVRLGLHEGNRMRTTKGTVSALAQLVKHAREDAASLKLSPETQKKVADAEATALALEAMYGVKPDNVGSPKN
jgi:hypothetical protein